MDDLISRAAAMDALNNEPRCGAVINQCGLEVAYEVIEDLPSAEPKRGKWMRDGHHIRCDQCGMYMCDTDREGDRIPTGFCPNCGAKMEVTI